MVVPSTVAVDAEEAHRGGRLRRLLQLDQRGELLVHVDLLLDLGELHELLGELVGVERFERVLVLQLRGQQPQERRRNSSRASSCWSPSGVGTPERGARRGAGRGI